MNTSWIPVIESKATRASLRKTKENKLPEFDYSGGYSRNRIGTNTTVTQDSDKLKASIVEGNDSIVIVNDSNEMEFRTQHSPTADASSPITDSQYLPAGINYVSPSLFTQTQQHGISFSTPRKHASGMYVNGKRIMDRIRGAMKLSLDDSASPLPQYPTVSQVMDALSPTDPSCTIRELRSEVLKCRSALQSEQTKSRELQEQLTIVQAELDMMKSSQIKLQEDVSLKGLAAAKANDQVAKMKREHEMETTELRTNLGKQMQVAENLATAVRDLETTVQELRQAKQDMEELQEKSSSVSDPEANQADVLYFRGHWNPLSAFFSCQLTPGAGVGRGATFRSLEHLFHFRKLVAHGLTSEAEQVKKAASPAEAKRLSARYLPKDKVSPAWLDSRLATMTELCILKAEQCPKFRETLVNTGTKSLVHNMESDGDWGFGSDGRGGNIMGKALEATRASLHQFIPNGASSSSSVDTGTRDGSSSDLPRPTGGVNKEKVLIIADSMLKGIDKHMVEFDVELFCFVGYTPSQLIVEVDKLLPGKNFSAIVVHCGTNCTTEASPRVQESFASLLKRIHWHCHDVRVLLSGVIHRLDDTSLNSMVDAINTILHSFENDKVVFVEHNGTIRHLRKALNGSGLHLRPNGLKQIAANLSLVLRTRLPSSTNVRQWVIGPQPKQKGQSFQKKQVRQRQPVSQPSYDKKPYGKPFTSKGKGKRPREEKRQRFRKQEAPSDNSKTKQNTLKPPTPEPAMATFDKSDQQGSFESLLSRQPASYYGQGTYQPASYHGQGSFPMWMSLGHPMVSSGSYGQNNECYTTPVYPPWCHPFMRSTPFRSWGPMM